MLEKLKRETCNNLWRQNWKGYRSVVKKAVVAVTMNRCGHGGQVG